MKCLVSSGCMFLAIFVTLSCSASNREKQDELIDYIEQGKIASIEEMLESGIDLDYQDERGETPLIVSIKFGNEEIAKKMIAYGANVNFPSSSGRTPLFVLIERQVDPVIERRPELELAKVLLDHGANPNYVVPKGELNISIFNAAVSGVLNNWINGETEQLIDWMIDAGANVNEHIGSPLSLLKKSMQRKNEQVVSQLICAGARPDENESEIKVTENSQDFYHVKYTLSSGRIFADYVVDCR